MTINKIYGIRIFRLFFEFFNKFKIIRMCECFQKRQEIFTVCQKKIKVNKHLKQIDLFFICAIINHLFEF